MQRDTPFVNNEYYHIYNRGVEKRKVFLKNADYFRFLTGIQKFNTTAKVSNLFRLVDQPNLNRMNEAKLKEAKLRSKLRSKLQELVEIVCYSLMPNHYHLVLRQLIDDGISKFMQKLGTGYTNYFNTKYKRAGVLFQGVFKGVHIDNDAYLLHLSRYIHLNCLGIISPDWKNKEIKDKKRAHEFLKTYKWSSFPFYLNKENPCLLNIANEIIISQFKSGKDYSKFVLSWTERDLKIIKDLAIDSYEI